MDRPIDEHRVAGVLRAGILAAWGPTLGIAAMVTWSEREPGPPRSWRIAGLIVASAVVVIVAALPVATRRSVRAGLLLFTAAMVWVCLPVAPVRLPVAVVFSALTAAVLSATNIRSMLAFLPVTWLALLLMLFELPILWRTGELLEWGEPSTFAYLFPESPPVIGRGGRLRPNLDARMVNPDKPGGVRIVTNTDGFRNERKYSTSKPSDETRVLNLGDSFSIGYRSGQADFFGAVLEEEINRSRAAAPITVLNAEVSDPATALYYVQEFGLEFGPATVVYGLCGNDVMQAYSLVGPGRPFALEEGRIVWRSPEQEPRADVREGWKRIVYPVECARPAKNETPVVDNENLPDRLTQLELIRRLAVWRRRLARTGEVTKSWMESDAAVGQRKRLLDGFPNLAFYYTGADDTVAPMYETCFAVLTVMAEQCRSNGTDFVLVLHPQRFVVQPQDWEAEVFAWCLREEDFDLDRMHRRIVAWCDSQGIPCVDLTSAFRETGRRKQLYLPGGDVHYNEAGHRLAGETVGRFLEQRVSTNGDRRD